MTLSYNAFLETAMLTAEQKLQNLSGKGLLIVANIEVAEMTGRMVNWCSLKGEGKNVESIISTLFSIQREAARQRDSLYSSRVTIPEQYTP